MPTIRVYSSIVKAIILLCVSASLWLALFTVAAAEEISAFVSDIAVQPDGTLLVTETIQYDFGAAERHGVYRKIAAKHAQPASAWYQERYIDLSLVRVTRNGEPEPYTLESYNGLSVRIGDPDLTITGTHTYRITYTVAGALAVYDGKTELYWNVTGDEWAVPIHNVTTVVHSASGVALGAAQACYVTGQDACAEKRLDQDEAVFTHAKLAPGQQLTVAQELTLAQPPVMLERTEPVLFGGIIAVLWLIGLATAVYRWRTTHRIARTVVSQYEPYADFKPMFTGVLFDNRLDAQDISAGILYLAQQGYISITQTSEKVLWLFDVTDYEITLERPVSESETAFQEELLQLLFKYSDAAGTMVRLSALQKSTTRRKSNYKRLQRLRKAVVRDLVARGFLEQRLSRVLRSLALAIFFSGVFILASFTFATCGFIALLFLVLLVITAIVLLLFATERRTQKGYTALNHLQGFKRFLSVTEKDRYAFHNAPAKNPEQFMEYLPYAIAFGVEKEWAEVFADIQLDAPEWYSSASGARFNATAFTGDIGAFSSAFSSSSGASGSSGGGSAGGGSGGGGGGSW